MLAFNARSGIAGPLLIYFMAWLLQFGIIALGLLGFWIVTSVSLGDYAVVVAVLTTACILVGGLAPGYVVALSAKRLPRNAGLLKCLVIGISPSLLLGYALTGVVAPEHSVWLAIPFVSGYVPLVVSFFRSRLMT